MAISTPFIRRPIATSLLMAGILMIGAVAYPLLPVAPLPQVDFPTIQVNTQFPGGGPETMASSVTAPLERQFAQIPGVTQMTSSSTLGNSSITVQFDLNRNIDGAAQDIQTAINAAGGQLPKTLPSPPTYRKVNPADAPILGLAVHSDSLPITVVDDYAENVLVQHISQIPGVAQVSISGQQKPSVRIQVDPEELASIGLGLEDVRAALTTVTTDSPKGSIDGATRTFTINANDQLLSAEPWNDVIVAYKKGAPVRVRDIGQAIEGPENTKQSAWANGKRAINLMVLKQPGANVVDTVDRIKAALPQLQAAIPPAVKVDILSDRTTTIRASIGDVQFTLGLTIALVVMVIFVFLRNFWATMIPSVTVPLALVGTFAIMYLFGYSLDNLSLMGLSIAVGFVVDDAIVVLENITRHMEMGKERMAAALEGAREISSTVLTMTISLVVVFVPIMFMQGMVGRLFREFAVTVGVSVLISGAVSLSITPMLCSRLLKPTHAHGRVFDWSERVFDGARNAYVASLRWVLNFQGTVLIGSLVVLLSMGLLYQAVAKGFIPRQGTGVINGNTRAREGTTFTDMIRQQQQIAEAVGKNENVEAVMSTAGQGVGGTFGDNIGRLIVRLKDPCGPFLRNRIHSLNR